MSNSTEFYSNFKNQILLSINTCMPCKVLSYNEGSRTAKIQPLFMVKEMNRAPEKLSVVNDVPVMFERVKLKNNTAISVSIPNSDHTQITFNEPVELEPSINAGDTVLVVFAQRSIDDAVEGNLVYPGASRLFDVHDAIIVGLL
ncbi:Gp138 family membrane-puncturing spike protein [Psychrobacillus sp. FSL K6-4615]|uniref:Gp138 family membrane-puncturing spike protein n=1 Tax=Psychrobacillus sp. FSL K6-4615 TaxID=2921551 RepID=UPI0030FB8A21